MFPNTWIFELFGLFFYYLYIIYILLSNNNNNNNSSIKFNSIQSKQSRKQSINQNQKEKQYIVIVLCV